MNYQIGSIPPPEAYGGMQAQGAQPPRGFAPGHASIPQQQQAHYSSSQTYQHLSKAQWYQQQTLPDSSTYGSYGNYYNQNVFSQRAWEATYHAHGGEQELWNIFSMEMNRSRVNQQHQAIQSEELHRIMNNTPQIRQYYKINWSLELCKIMLSMMDRNPDGFMQWSEFKEMLQCIYHWYNTFQQFDVDRSGFIEAHELSNVVKSFGYVVDARVMETLLRRYSRVADVPGGTSRCLISFDNFICLCIRLRAYTDAFRKRDQAENGTDTGVTRFAYSDFLQCVLSL